ncbi:MAG: S9 family peptidase, partial [Terracidiphilus sp.]
MSAFLTRKGLLSASCLSTSLIFTLVSGLPAAHAQAVSSPEQSPHRARIEQVFEGLGHGRSIGEVAVSPDGRRVAWIEGRGEGLLSVAPIADLSKAERVPVTLSSPVQHCRQSEAIWAPDSKALAFFSNCESPGGQMELYLSKLDGTPAKRLTELKGYESSPAFSPDGTKIAFLYVEGATRPAGALAAMKPSSGVIGEEGIEIQRVAMAAVDPAAPAAPQQVTPANLHAYEFDWAPDSQGLAYIAAQPPGENNWWVAKLYTQKIGGPARAILAPTEIAGPLHNLQIAVPRWSPDGSRIAFIGGLMSDQGSTGGDIWIVSAEGGALRDLTPGRQSSPAWIEWDGNHHLFVSEFAGGSSDLVRFQIKGDQLADESHIISIPGSVGDGRLEGSLSSTADRSLWVFSASSFERPPEIYSVHAGNVSPVAGFAGITQLSHVNDGVVPVWGKAVSLDWKNEGYDVQGWLLLPQDYDPQKKYPLIVEVHGGPAALVEPRWGSGGGISAVALSALGYFVLAPNPRGSYGQGEAFTQANREDFGYGDL